MPNEIAHFAQLPDAKRAQRDFVLVDGSASMTGNWWPLMDALQAYIDTLRKNGTESYGTLAVFSDEDLDMVQRDEFLSKWLSVVDHPITSTWGDTPLYDAINVMARRLRDEDPKCCSITIITDGDNNSSSFTDQVQAKAILDWCRAKGWQVTFIGCDWNNEDMAAKLGGHPNAAIGVSKAMLKDAAEELANKRSRHATSGAPMHWSEDEKHQFGGYLAGPSQ